MQASESRWFLVLLCLAGLLPALLAPAPALAQGEAGIAGTVVDDVGASCPA